MIYPRSGLTAPPTGVPGATVSRRLPGGGASVAKNAGATPMAESFKWLTIMRDRMGADFVHGITFYTGNEVVPFGDRLTALPIEVLWSLH